MHTVTTREVVCKVYNHCPIQRERGREYLIRSYKKMPSDPSYNTDYESWGKWSDIGEDVRAGCQDLKAILTMQGKARGFQSHQNWPQRKKTWVWKRFDTDMLEDVAFEKSWVALADGAAKAWDQHIIDEKRRAKEKEEEEKRREGELLEEARARAMTLTQTPLTQASSTTAAPAPPSQEAPEPTNFMFSIVPDQRAPMLLLTKNYSYKKNIYGVWGRFRFFFT